MAGNWLDSGRSAASAQEETEAPVEARVALKLIQSSGSASGAPNVRPPSSDECAEIARGFDATTSAIVNHLAASDAFVRATLDAEGARSRAWVGDGCPSHPIYGIAESPDGSSEVRLLDLERLGR